MTMRWRCCFFAVKNYTLLQWQCDDVSSPFCDVINVRKRKEEEKKWLKLIATREENDLVISDGNVQLIFIFCSKIEACVRRLHLQSHKKHEKTLARTKIALFSLSAGFQIVELSKRFVRTSAIKCKCVIWANCPKTTQPQQQATPTKCEQINAYVLF